MKSKLSLLLAVSLLATGLVGCGNKAEKARVDSMEALYVASAKEAPVEANPEAALNAVYDVIEVKQGSCDFQKLSGKEFSELTGITDVDAIEIVAGYSNPQAILSDVFIIKPYPSLREDVSAKLLSYRESRMKEFENFDILDAYSIAKNAVVYDQGEYLVLLMLTDNDSAQQQIDTYIPQ